jgi:hypothetical protein
MTLRSLMAYLTLWGKGRNHSAMPQAAGGSVDSVLQGRVCEFGLPQKLSGNKE